MSTIHSCTYSSPTSAALRTCSSDETRNGESMAPLPPMMPPSRTVEGLERRVNPQHWLQYVCSESLAKFQKAK